MEWGPPRKWLPASWRDSPAQDAMARGPATRKNEHCIDDFARHYNQQDWSAEWRPRQRCARWRRWREPRTAFRLLAAQTL